MLKLLLGIGAVLTVARGDYGCAPRFYDADSIVCVCNATYCDVITKPPPPQSRSYYQYVSDKGGQRMNFTIGEFSDKSTPHEYLVDRKKTYQSIFGFGGAFTDAAGINIKTLSSEAQDKLISSYYCPKTGSGYTLGRIPIGGTDFSTRPYTYDDHENDIDLSHFALAEEDLLYKIPFLRKALDLRPDIKFFAAAWSAPPWMKTNNDYTGSGFLKRQYYQLYAEYLIKYLEAYQAEGIRHWGISTGNEPANAFTPFFKINNMGWTPTTMGIWIAENLCPTLAKSPFNDTLILALDDQRFEVPWYLQKVFLNEKAKKCTAGVALHWYWDRIFSAERLDVFHNLFPDKFLLMTEASTGTKPQYSVPVKLGSWARAETYIRDIVESLNHWHTGWVDWNLALDLKGGPNWVDNQVDASIIINKETDEFYKQPLYYAIQHFSKFITQGSVRIDMNEIQGIQSCAFQTPDNTVVVVMYNTGDDAKSVTIRDEGRSISTTLGARSLNTIIYAI